MINKDIPVYFKQLNHASWFHLFELPDEIIQYYWDCIKTAEQNNISSKHRASGVISKILELEDPKNIFNEQIFPRIFNGPQQDRYAYIITRYHHSWSKNIEIDLQSYLMTLQVNYQKKYEYNPLHYHSGLFSFVIWMKIPYDINNERNLDIATNFREASNFAFVYNSDWGVSTEYIQPKENYCCIFPSHLNHLVYPFYTSDENRISITGNIGFHE